MFKQWQREHVPPSHRLKPRPTEASTTNGHAEDSEMIVEDGVSADEEVVKPRKKKVVRIQT